MIGQRIVKWALTMGTLSAAVIYSSAVRADTWTDGGSGVIFSFPSTRVGVGNTAPVTELDVVSNTSARATLRVNQQQTNANIAEFRQGGNNKVVITAGGVLQAQTVTSTSPVGPAVSATSTSGNGVFASSSTGNAVSAQSTSTTGAGIGVYAISGTASGAQTGISICGVYGVSSKGFGVYGETTRDSTDMAGVYGYTATNGAAGVLGRHVTLDNQALGVFGDALAPTGVFESGIVPGNGIGVQGQSGSFGGVFKSLLGDCHRDAGGNPLTRADGTFDCVAGSGSAAFGDSAQGTGLYGLSRRVAGYRDVNTGAPTYDVNVGAYGVKGRTESLSGAFAGVYGEVDVNASADGAAIVGNAHQSNVVWAGLFFGDVDVQGNGFFQNGSFVASDARLKKDVVSSPYGLREVLRVRPVTYKWKDGNDDQSKIGVIAQEIQKVLPEVVTTNRANGMLAVEYTQIVPVTIRAIQEQQATIQRQVKQLQDLEDRVRALETSRQPVASSAIGGFGLSCLAVSLLPVGLLIARRRQNRNRS